MEWCDVYLCPPPPRAYLNAVLPMTGGQGVELPSSLEPMAGLRSLPVSDAVKALMVNGEGRCVP